MEGSPERHEGWKPWVMWGIPAFIFLVAFFHRVAPGVVAKELMESFGADDRDLPAHQAGRRMILHIF